MALRRTGLVPSARRGWDFDHWSFDRKFLAGSRGRRLRSPLGRNHHRHTSGDDIVNAISSIANPCAVPHVTFRRARTRAMRGLSRSVTPGARGRAPSGGIDLEFASLGVAKHIRRACVLARRPRYIHHRHAPVYDPNPPQKKHRTFSMKCASNAPLRHNMSAILDVFPILTVYERPVPKTTSHARGLQSR